MASSKTITWAFSLYMFSFAAVMVFAPGPLITSLNAALDLSRPLVDLAPLPLEGVMWVRVLGLVTSVVAYYYYNLADEPKFIRLSIHGRILFFIFACITFIIYRDTISLVVGIVGGGFDTIGALITLRAVKAEEALSSKRRSK